MSDLRLTDTLKWGVLTHIPSRSLTSWQDKSEAEFSRQNNLANI